MHMFKQEKQPFIPTPPLRYFLEKSRGNTDLANFEAAALNHVKLILNLDPAILKLNPAEQYFQMKMEPPGIIGPHMRGKVLENKELQAMAYVQPWLDEYIAESADEVQRMMM